MRIRFGAFEGGDLKKHSLHLLLQIPQLHQVSLALDLCMMIHLQFAVGMRLVNGSSSAGMGSRIQSQITQCWTQHEQYLHQTLHISSAAIPVTCFTQGESEARLLKYRIKTPQLNLKRSYWVHQTISRTSKACAKSINGLSHQFHRLSTLSSLKYLFCVR